LTQRCDAHVNPERQVLFSKQAQLSAPVLHVAPFELHPNAAANPKRRAAQAHRVRISAE